MDLVKTEKKENITSLELLNKINEFREKVESKNYIQHKDLLKIIRDEFEEEINGGKFSPVEYKDKKGELRPMYILTFNQAKQLLIRESKKVRKLVIEYIENLENALKNKFNVPTNFKEALLLAVKQQEQLETLALENKIKEQQIKELQPKVTYYDVVLKSKSLIPITLIAKDYGMSAVEFNKLLHNLGIQYKLNNMWLLYVKYQDLGYTGTKTVPYTNSYGITRTTIQTYWTQKGRLFIYDTLKSKNILPLIEKNKEKKEQ